MSGSHWLLLIPFYFFTALATLLFVILLTRLMRIGLSINILATAGVLAGLTFVIAPVTIGWLSLADYTVARMLLLVAATCVLALIDAIFQRWLPLPADKELSEL